MAEVGLGGRSVPGFGCRPGEECASEPVCVVVLDLLREDEGSAQRFHAHLTGLASPAESDAQEHERAADPDRVVDLLVQLQAPAGLGGVGRVLGKSDEPEPQSGPGLSGQITKVGRDCHALLHESPGLVVFEPEGGQRRGRIQSAHPRGRRLGFGGQCLAQPAAPL